MEKEIYCLHYGLKSKSTVINLLLQTLIKYKDEIMFIQIMISETFTRKKTKTAKSVEIKEREITSGEQLNMILNEGDHLITRHPTKIIMLKLEKNHVEITVQTIRHKMRVMPTAGKDTHYR